MKQIKANAGSRMQRANSPGKARILLVDDDERNLLALSQVLQELAEVVCVTSGHDALRALLDGDFAVILLDVFMPGLDGYETASLIRARDQTSRIPIIFLSAVNKETEHLMRGYAMGAVDYVFKPVEPMMLQSKVSVFVDLYEMRAEVEAKSRAEQALRDANFKAELEKLQIGRELEVSRTRQEAIIQSLPIVLYLEPLMAEPRCPAFVSGDLEAMTGYDFDTVRAQPTLWQERIHPEDRDRVLESLAERESTGRFSIEYRWQASDGEYRFFHDQAVLLRDDAGNPLEFAGTLLDVTAQRRLEAQLVQAGKMEAIGQLTGGVAHDFNNLLAAVIGGIHVLERRLDLGEREQMIIDQIRHAAEHGAELVRRMMAFARKQDLVPTSVDPSELCVTVAGLVEHTLGGTVAIDWQCPETRSNLFVDKSQLELALLNLILNARDAMPDGGEVTVSISELSALHIPDDATLLPGDYLSIRVTDAGGGIEQSEIEKITQPFYTTKEAGKGTGLGLSMVLGFVQQSGGRLVVTSKVGSGTRVEMILPSTPQPALKKAKADLPIGATSVRSILLVDDDDAVRTVVGEQLRELGFEVVAAADGAGAISAIDEGAEFDLLLSDFAMPGINGVQTIKRIQSMRPDIRSALMTGYADDSLEKIDREAITVFRKPINIDELMGFLAS